MKNVLALLCAFLVFNCLQRHTVLWDYSLDFVDRPSAIGTKEDPQARASYELSLLADPKTGQIPRNIRPAELEFSRSIPLRAAHYRAAGMRVASRNYELAGPFNVGGRTRAIAFDVRNENTIIAGGVSGGIWKTTNGGTIWTRTSDPTLRNSVTALAQDIRSGKEATWYFGTGELVGNSARSPMAPYRGAGIYKSTDEGATWQVLASTLDNATPDEFSSQFQYIWDIETNHTNTTEDEVLVAAYGGILRSLDGGENWTLVLGEQLFGLPDGTDLNEFIAPFYTSLKKTPSGGFFAAMSSATSASDQLTQNSGLFFSPDGSTWQEITPPDFPAYHERTVIGVAQDESAAYFLTQGNLVTLWKLSDMHLTNGVLGGSWEDLSANVPNMGGEFGNYNSQTSYNMLIEVHPQNPNAVFIGGTNLYRSTNGFATSNNTKWIGGYSPDNDASVYPGHYPDQHKVLFYPSDPRRMISANDGGIRLSTNGLADSVQWTSLNNGYLTSQFYTIAQRHDKATDEILGGMQDNGSYLRDAVGENPAWNRILGGDGAYCAITPNSDFIYTSFQKGQVYRLSLSSSYQLSSFARVDPVDGGGKDGTNYLFINPFILDPQNPNRMFLLDSNVIWRNDNLLQIPGGSQQKTRVNWSRISGSQLSTGSYTALEKCINADILYAGILDDAPGIMKVEHASDPLREETSTFFSGLFPEGGHIACIAANPENADHIVVVFSNYGVRSAFMSEDGGSTFTDISANLEESADGSGSGPSARWAEIVPTTDGLTYFVGTSTGLYSASPGADGDFTWVKESEDEIGNAVITMMDYRDHDGRLVVATHGNGAFRVFLEDARSYQNQPINGDGLTVEQNYPNPFSGETTLVFNLPEPGEVRANVFDSRGSLVRTLLWGPQYAGENRIIWDGTNHAGAPVKPGLYHCVLQYHGQQVNRRILYEP